MAIKSRARLRDAATRWLVAAVGIEGWSTRVGGPLMVWVDSAATGKPQLYAAMNPL
jgi:hypothetical protein